MTLLLFCSLIFQNILQTAAIGSAWRAFITTRWLDFNRSACLRFAHGSRLHRNGKSARNDDAHDGGGER
jgi:hypothetical protein